MTQPVNIFSQSMFVVRLIYSNFPKILRQKRSSLLDFSLLFGRLLCQIKRLTTSQRRNDLLIILSNIAFNFVSSLLLYISRIFFSPDITLKPQFPLIALRSELDRILVFSKQVHTSTVVKAGAHVDSCLLLRSPN